MEKRKELIRILLENVVNKSWIVQNVDTNGVNLSVQDVDEKIPQETRLNLSF